MKKIVMSVLLAVSALSGSANIRTIQMNRGENRISVIQAPSGILRVLGAEYFTTEKTGNVKMSVRKIFSGKVKDYTVTPITDTVITRVTDWWEYKWEGIETMTTNNWSLLPTATRDEEYRATATGFVTVTNFISATQHDGDRLQFDYRDDTGDYGIGKFPRSSGYITLNENPTAGTMRFRAVFPLELWDNGDTYISVDKTIPLTDESHFDFRHPYVRSEFGGWIEEGGHDVEGSNFRICDYELHLRATEKIEHWHNVTNTYTIGAITNWYNAVVSNTNTIDMIASTPLTNGYANISIESPKYIYINDTIIIDAPITKDKPGIVRLIVDTEN